MEWRTCTQQSDPCSRDGNTGARRNSVCNFLLNRSDCSINVIFTNCLINREFRQICYKYMRTVTTFGYLAQGQKSFWLKFCCFCLTHQRGRTAFRSRAPSTGGKERKEATIVFASLRHRHHAADRHLKDDHTFRYRNRKYETSNKTYKLLEERRFKY